ncbi:PilN domain-containing protein [Arenimonas terrae]|jgi:general secretion pathway protein L|uniref:General secretion pathway protein GspL n=1 Tax=Arenimonas terrae TaxID=2546226 RepID=A0A5C4RW93_9GAMM|nr:PilN domain-containing protein [Arenimonas terrae]TNJ35553.1 general secretion pathway protein GspL [Arenimonas terrae]
MPAADRFSALVEPLRLRLAASPLPRWSRDAAQTVLGLLPARWRDWVVGEQQRLYLLRHQDEIALIAGGRSGDRELGRLPLEESVLASVRQRLDDAAIPAWLLLPSANVLRRSLSLPTAAEPRLREVLAFELDRQTPFSADQVSHQGRVLSRDPATQQMQVELLVLPRARLEAELHALGPLAEGLAGVDAIEPDGRRLGLNLLPAGRREQGRDPVRRLNALLALVAGAALLGALLLTLHNRSERLEDLRRQVAQATDDARQARQVRNQLQISAQAANFLATSRASRPTMLELLDDLSRRIPDDTSLDKLAVNEGKLVMVGQSRAAPALVGLLQASPLLSGPALSGAVQADPRSGRDRFTLTADVVEQGSPEAGDDVRR